MALVFVKNGDGGEVKPVAITSGSVLNPDHLQKSEKATDAQIKDLLNEMKKKDIAETMEGLGFSFGQKNMTKKDMIGLVMKNIDTISTKAKETFNKSEATSSGDNQEMDFKVFVKVEGVEKEIVVVSSPSVSLEKFLSKVKAIEDKAEVSMDNNVLLAVVGGVWCRKMKDDTLGDYLMKNEAIGNDYELLIVHKDDYDYQKHEGSILSSDESEKSDTSDESEEEEPLEIKLNEPKENGRSLVILVPREIGETKLLYYFDASTHADELFALLPEVFGKSMTVNVDFELKWAGTGSRVEEYDFLYTYFFEETTVLNFHLKNLGGVNFTLKKPMKRGDAMKHFKDKSIANVLKSADIEPSSHNAPPEIMAFVNSVEETMNGIKLMKSQNIAVVRAGLKQINDGDLQLLRDLMPVPRSGRKGNTEERVAKAIFILFSCLGQVDCSIKAIDALKNKVLSELMSIFCEEYSIFEQGYVRFNIDQFISDIQSEETRRSAIREVGVSAYPAPESGNGCQMM